MYIGFSGFCYSLEAKVNKTKSNDILNIMKGTSEGEANLDTDLVGLIRPAAVETIPKSPTIP
jgi:hypothetical protein